MLLDFNIFFERHIIIKKEISNINITNMKHFHKVSIFIIITLIVDILFALNIVFEIYLIPCYLPDRTIVSFNNFVLNMCVGIMTGCMAVSYTHLRAHET